MFCVRKSFLLIVLLVVSFAGASSVAQDWPQWRGADGKNHSPETNLFEKWGEDGPKLKWTAEGLGSGYATVSVAGGKIFTSGNTESAQQITAYSLDGKQIWATPITGQPPKHPYKGGRTTPTYHDGKLYVVSSNGIILCLDAERGKKLWTRDFKKEWNGKMMSTWGFSESPLVDGDNVICTPGGSEGMVVALNLENGDEVWACVLPDYGEKVANGVANIPTSIIDGDFVFTSTAYNTGSALLKLSGANDADGGVNVEEQYWLDGRKFQNKLGGMTLVDGHIYCGHGNGAGLPVCLEMKTGEVKWGPLRAKGRGESSMIFADGHLVWRRQDGHVILVKVNNEDMEVINSFMPDYQEGNSWAQPVIADGVLYLREQDKLMAYQLK